MASTFISLPVPPSSTTATTATNLAGGAGGSVPYQSAASTTAMLANGTVGQILTSSGGTAAPTWKTTQSSGTLATMAALTGADGQLFWNTTYKAMFIWVVDRWVPYGYIDKRYGFYVEDEFLGFSSGSQMTYTSTNSGNLGNNQTRPGVFYVEPSTAATRGFLQLYSAGTNFGTADLYLETAITIPTLATGAQDFCAAFGFNDNSAYDANSACTDGAYFTLNRAVNGINWITNTTNNGANTATNTSTAVVASTWYRLNIIVSQTNSNVLFYVNGTLIATHTTNIPSGAARQTGVMWKVDKTVGNNAVDMYIDYFSMYGFFTGGARVA